MKPNLGDVVGCSYNQIGHNTNSLRDNTMNGRDSLRKYSLDLEIQKFTDGEETRWV